MLKLSKKLQTVIVSAACGLALNATAAMAAENDVLKVAYQPVADVSQDQAQIVYFRPAALGSAQGNANVYVDGEFQTALIPGSYTAFCMKPGAHTLGAWLKDDPLYQGKQDTSHRVSLEGGKTYYIQVDQGKSRVLGKAAATEMLKQTRLQNILQPRASAVVACRYTYKDYTLASDVMFAFGQSSQASITSTGRQEVNHIAQEVAKQNGKVVVIGHTDPIGSASSNQRLGLKRAQTVRDLLVDEGVNAANISVASVGSREPVATGCEGLAKQQKIACYAPDRRVVIRSYQK